MHCFEQHLRTENQKFPTKNKSTKLEHRFSLDVLDCALPLLTQKSVADGAGAAGMGCKGRIVATWSTIVQVTYALTCDHRPAGSGDGIRYRIDRDRNVLASKSRLWFALTVFARGVKRSGPLAVSWWNVTRSTNQAAHCCNLKNTCKLLGKCSNWRQSMVFSCAKHEASGSVCTFKEHIVSVF